MIYRYLFIAFFSFFLCTHVDAQLVDQEEIRKQLENEGIDESEVQRRLIARGFDIQNIDPNDPEAFAAIRKATEEIIEELKLENAEAIIEEVQTQDTIPSDGLTSKEQIESSEALDAFVNDVAVEEVEELPVPKVYGHDLYREGGIKFYKKTEYVQPTPSYVLGPGDNITVAIWGRTEFNVSKEVTKEGFVKFSRIPRIYLSGLTLEQAKRAIEAKIKNSFNFDSNYFEVSVAATRNVNIFISGDVNNVGSYNISSLNTAINALAAAGGPSDIGSVRKIQLIHPDGTKANIDLYKFLKDPTISQNYYLQDNDFIVVPVANKVITIEGAVNRPFRYELIDDEDLADLIEYAGGLSVDAFRKNIKITRIENDNVVILNVNLNESENGKGVTLRNGDIVEVAAIDSRVRNAVTVEGAIENAGEFALTPDMRISDLMAKTVLLEDALLDLAYLVRLNDDRRTVRYEIINLQSILNNGGAEDKVLLPGDKLILRAKSEFVSKRSFVINGAVRSGGEYDLDGDAELKLSDAVYLSGGLNDRATNFAYVIRKPSGQLNTEYLSVDLFNALNNPQSDDNINILPGDVIRVYDQAQYFDETFVTIQGAVREPQSFTYDASLSLKDVILQAGGLKLEAAKNKIDIFRIEFQNNNRTRTLVANASVDENLNITGDAGFQLKPFDQIVVRTAPEFELQRAVTINGEVKYPGTFFLVDDNSTLLDVIKSAGGMTEEAFVGGATLFRSQDAVGFIVVDLARALAKPNSTLNIILQEGDVIDIPKKNNLVTLRGAVKRSDAFAGELAAAPKTNFIYEKGKGVKYYIESAGGFDDDADKSSVTVTHPNGERHSVKRFLFFKNYPEVVPGSIIDVGFKEEEVVVPGQEDEDIDWGNILSNSIAQATAILSLILLIQNVD